MRDILGWKSDFYKYILEVFERIMEKYSLEFKYTNIA
jgi:hypothetical protein